MLSIPYYFYLFVMIENKENKEYLTWLNTCTRKWLTELEQSTPVN